MTQPLILIVDDEPDIRDIVSDVLRDEGYQVELAENAFAANQALKRCKPDLILLDIWMPEVDGITLLKEWADTGPLPSPVIIMSGHGTIETAVEATRLGAYDFIEKPLSTAKMLLTIERAIEANRLYKEVDTLRQRNPMPTEPIGRSRAILELKELLKRVANFDTWVLIQGEAGTGKMSAARYIHELSPRRTGPFIEAAASIIAGSRSSQELFGFEQDNRVYYGLLEQANHGTLFIDEVGELDLATQGRLLSALESRKVVRIDGVEPIEIDVRVIAATRSRLDEAVKKGSFREELYYQLNVLPIRIPSLRERPEDIPDLLAYYTEQCVQLEHLRYRHFSIAAQNLLRQYPWPGNIRELRNLVQRLLILGTQEEIGAQELQTSLGIHSAATRSASAGNVAADSDPTGNERVFELSGTQNFKEARERFERAYFLQQLELAGGSVGELARRVGLERTNLYRKLKSLGIDPKEPAKP